MTHPEADENLRPAPTQPPLSAAPPVAETVALPVHPYEPEPEPPQVFAATEVAEPAGFTARPASPAERQVLFIPLAVNIGDGFKFGCGFFLALVLAMLIGFVLLAILFVLTTLFGVNLPIGR